MVLGTGADPKHRADPYSMRLILIATMIRWYPFERRSRDFKTCTATSSELKMVIAEAGIGAIAIARCCDNVNVMAIFPIYIYVLEEPAGGIYASFRV